MNEVQISLARAMDFAAADETAEAAIAAAPLEFVGSSDDTIGEAVRRALSDASTSLRTLEGVGVVVIPQMSPFGNGPRFRVTLRIARTTAVAATTPHAFQA